MKRTLGRLFFATTALVATTLAGLLMACADPPAQDASDLTQFPAAASVPPVHAPASSSEGVWPDAGLNPSK